MKKLSAVLLSAVAVAGLGLQGTATAAATDWPTGCVDFKSPVGNGWAAKCSSSNGGHYKATAICERWDGGLINVDAVAWNTSNYSYASCPPGTNIKSGGFISRSY
ncbi:hypothetical protein ACWC5F_10730 [Streptomyces sp. NPDC001272]